MDFVTLLRRDHEKVSSLFHQIQHGYVHPDTPERYQLFGQLKKELELHAAVEELHVYRAFQQSESTRDDALRNLVLPLKPLSKRSAVTHRRRKEGLQSKRRQRTCLPSLCKKHAHCGTVITARNT